MNTLRGEELRAEGQRGVCSYHRNPEENHWQTVGSAFLGATLAPRGGELIPSAGPCESDLYGLRLNPIASNHHGETKLTSATP